MKAIATNSISIIQALQNLIIDNAKLQKNIVWLNSLIVRDNRKQVIYLGVFTLFLSIVTTPSFGNTHLTETFSSISSPMGRDAKSSSTPSLILSETIPADAALEWNIKTLQEGDYYNYYLTEVSYRSQSKILWTVSLPKRMTSRMIERSYKEPVNIRTYNKFPFLLGTIFTQNAVFIANDGGVLILDRKTGKILDDQSSKISSDHFYIDVGTVTLVTPTESCKGRINGGKFFRECGEYLIYFNGKNLWVWDQSSQLVETTNYNRKIHNIETHKPLTYKVIIPMKTVTVEINGFFVR